MKKVVDILLRLRGISFLILAAFFFFVEAYEVSSRIQYSLGVGARTFLVYEIFFWLALVSALPGCLALIIGGWGVFETLRRAHRRAGIFALVGLGLFFLPIIASFISPLFDRSSQPIQLETSTAWVYLFQILIAAWYWLCVSMIGLALCIPKTLPRILRIGGLMIITSMPADTLLWFLSSNLYRYLPGGPLPLFLLMNMTGFLLIGIGFLSPAYRRSPIPTQPPDLPATHVAP